VLKKRASQGAQAIGEAPSATPNIDLSAMGGSSA